MSAARPHFQQAVYDEGYTAGRRDGFEVGKHFGRETQKFDDDYKLPMGMAIGLVIGAVIQPIVFWLKGVCW